MRRAPVTATVVTPAPVVGRTPPGDSDGADDAGVDELFEGLGLADVLSDGLALGDSLGLSDSLADGEGLVDSLADGDGLADSLTDGDGLGGLWDRVTVGDGYGHEPPLVMVLAGAGPVAARTAKPAATATIARRRSMNRTPKDEDHSSPDSARSNAHVTPTGTFRHKPLSAANFASPAPERR
jgi:hypothetical protein